MLEPRFHVPDGFFVRRGGVIVARRLRWRTVDRGDREYPSALEQISNPPARLWVAGRSLAELPPCVAVVGPRRANGYGLAVARDLAADLAQQGVCVVSGLALGADAAAHDGALGVAGATVAVLGCGVNVCHPVRNRSLYAEIAERGTLVSELPPDTPALRPHFPARNRIIAGLSLGVVVVQAGKGSGALITGRLALDAGREVFGVPGQIDWPESAGVHQLLREGASLCAGVGDVVGQIGRGLSCTAAEDLPIPPTLPAPQQLVLAALKGGAATCEFVCSAAGLDATTATRALAALEVAGHIAAAGGSRVRRVR
jgi:DNA processing protein